MNFNKEVLFLFLIFLCILLFGAIVGRYVGIAQTNNYYHEEEVVKEYCRNYERSLLKIPNLPNINVNLSFG